MKFAVLLLVAGIGYTTASDISTIGSNSTSSSNNSTAATRNKVCFVGWVMDHYCINLTYLLDKGPSYPTLEVPDEHSVYCLIDIPVCRNSHYELLSLQKNNSGFHEREVRLNHPEGTELVAAFVENERANGLTKGVKATIIGEGVGDSSDGTMPPEITVLQVLPASTGCE